MTAPLHLLRHCWFLAGPTAGGKSAVSLELARRLGAEIISLDSMAIYRGMDIGTAKPTVSERGRVPHHLIDIADPHEEFSVAEYLRLAWDAVSGVIGRGQIPLFVGGTGLYLRSMLRGVFEGPPADPGIRDELETDLRQDGPLRLHDRLRSVDAASANRIHPNDSRRVIRAIEVFRLTGRPLSEQQSQPPLPQDQQPRAVLWLDPPRDWLHQRIGDRVDRMMDAGLLDETRRLLESTPPPGRTALQALGYRELIDHLHDRCNLHDAVEQIKTNTRQFAKRQHTWFRNLVETTAVPITGEETTSELVARLESAAHQSKNA
ncbi:MAG: tRNA (adenosine(37)-N6)-dimethylallyltransferase MiaA [Planctomycetaceae bacterium]